MYPLIINNQNVTIYFKGELYQKDLSDEVIKEIKFRNNAGKLKRKHIKKWFITGEGLNDVIVGESSYLEKRGNSYYREGINISMPELLVKEYIKNEDYPDIINGLDNFWRLCALNPDPVAREDLFKFLKRGKFTITPSGYIVTYRNVNIKQEGDLKLTKFVTKNWIKLKKNGQDPKQYNVYKVDFGYSLAPSVINDTKIGNLNDLFENISQVANTVYTDAHTGTFKIRLGEVVSMPREDCEPDPKQSCAPSLHVGNKTFAKPSYFGNQAVVCLLNPAHVVAVPVYDNNKLRCCEYLPIALTEYDENGLVEVDTTLLEYEYTQYTTKQVQEMIQNSNVIEHKKHEFKTLEDLKGMFFNTISMELDKAYQVSQERHEVDESWEEDYYCYKCGIVEVDYNGDWCDYCEKL